MPDTDVTTQSDTIATPRLPSAETPERIGSAFADIAALLHRQHLIEDYAKGELEEDELSDAERDMLHTVSAEQSVAELRDHLDRLHPADIAYILEALPPDDRLYIWGMVKSEYDGEILVELPDAVRETLISSMNTDELVAATESLSTDEIADIVHDLPQKVIDDVFHSLSTEEREELRTAMSFDEDMVGALMDFDEIQVRGNVTLETVFRYLRRFDQLPTQTDQVFVVDKNEILQGVLPIHTLLVSDEDQMVSEVMQQAPIVLQQHENAADAAHAFERYDLVSAPVVDQDNKLVGRVTVDEILDFIKERAEEEVLAHAGLREEEDIFASVWKSFQNRWVWLAVNLVTAFIASRVIGVFEHTIEQLVALAALMPIVAGIGGNSGNQTITMIVRSMALGQISTANARQLLRKELLVSLVNGLVWGSVMGFIAFLIYDYNWMLGLVMVMAMVLNMLLAALMGVLIPVLMQKLGRDPALGSSVLITSVTDSGGFFIFLGLASVFLM